MRNRPRWRRCCSNRSGNRVGFCRCKGKVRRITKVVVDEPDIRQRFGISSYYQMDVMVPVGNQTIEIRGEHGEAAGPVYRSVFPFTYCALRLPPPGSRWREQPNVSRPVVMNGVFLKLWAFSNPLGGLLWTNGSDS